MFVVLKDNSCACPSCNCHWDTKTLEMETWPT